MIKTSNLLVRYGTKEIAFEDVSIKKNKITFIKGKNGTGKTTLFKAISRLLDYEGFITNDGFVTYCSQEPVIFRRTVYENIVYPLEIRKLNLEDYDNKIDEYSKLLECDHLLNKDANKLSSGEKMKTSILRSLIFEPDYVLLDEPTTHLDIDSIDALIKLIKRLREKITFVIVSHNKQFIDELKEEEITLGE